MSTFPISPVNNEIVTVANVAYQYNSATNSWRRVIGNIVNLSVSGNVTTGNLQAAGAVSAVGNVTGNYILGNGALLTGVITSVANINNGTSNVTVVSSGGNVTVGIGGTSNVAEFSTTGVRVTGLVSATGNVTAGNLSTSGTVTTGLVGSNLIPSANVTYSLGNTTNRWQDLWIANSSIYLGNIVLGATATALTVDGVPVVTSVANAISVSGNITGGNLLTPGLVSAAGNITGANILTGGEVSAIGNITGSYIIGNGSQLTGLPAGYSNANASAFLANLGSNTISTTGTVTAGNVTGGNILTAGLISATGNVAGGNVTTAGEVTATGNVTGNNVNTGTVRGASTLTISTGGGTLTLAPTAGNINVSNVTITNLQDPVNDQDAATKLYVDSVAEGLNVHDAVAAATTDTLANITSGTITYNNGSSGVGATLVTTGTFNLIDTVNVQTSGTRILVRAEANAVTNGVYVWSNATVITRASDYDTIPEVEAGDFVFVLGGSVYGNTGWVQVGNITSIGSAGNNINFTQFSGQGTFSANTSAGLSLIGTVFNAKVDDVTTAFDGGGNITVKAGANLTTPNIGAATGTSLSVTGNVDAGNLRTAGTVTATGNVTSGNILTAGLISATGDAQAGNILTAGLISATGNITGGNILTAGLISVTGNITANYFIGNGSQLSNLNAFNKVSVSGQSNVLANTTPGLTFVAGSNISITTDAANGTITFNQSSTTSIFATGGDMGLVTQAVTSSEDLGLVTEAVTEFYDLGSVVTTGSFDTLTVTGNTTTGNLLTGGIVSATGNITGNYFLGNGSQLTGISTGNSSIIITETTISANVTLNTGQNGLSVGPMTTANGVSVSVATGQRWIIL